MSIARRVWNLLKLYSKPIKNHNHNKNYNHNYTNTSNNNSYDDSDFQQDAGIVPPDVKKSLEVFDLKAPSSLSEVERKKRNLLQKYHPDKFSRDAEKEKVATEFTQIVNEAYDTLRKYYKNT